MCETQLVDKRGRVHILALWLTLDVPIQSTWFAFFGESSPFSPTIPFAIILRTSVITCLGPSAFENSSLREASKVREMMNLKKTPVKEMYPVTPVMSSSDVVTCEMGEWER